MPFLKLYKIYDCVKILTAKLVETNVSNGYRLLDRDLVDMT